MSKQSYVLQSPTGSFLKGVSAWRKELTDDLQEARVYTSKGAANNSRNHIPRYAKGSITELTVVPVKLVLDTEAQTA